MSSISFENRVAVITALTSKVGG